MTDCEPWWQGKYFKKDRDGKFPYINIGAMNALISPTITDVEYEEVLKKILSTTHNFAKIALI